MQGAGDLSVLSERQAGERKGAVHVGTVSAHHSQQRRNLPAYAVVRNVRVRGRH